MGPPPSWINQERWDVDPIATLSVPEVSFSFFSLSLFLCEEVHDCLRNGDRNAEAAAAARLWELLSLHCTLQLSPEAQEANWKRCGINPSLGELC